MLSIYIVPQLTCSSLGSSENVRTYMTSRSTYLRKKNKKNWKTNAVDKKNENGQDKFCSLANFV